MPCMHLCRLTVFILKSNVILHHVYSMCLPKTCVYLCLIVVLLTVTKKWNQFRYLSADKWIRKARSIYTMEFYSIIRKNETVVFVKNNKCS